MTLAMIVETPRLTEAQWPVLQQALRAALRLGNQAQLSLPAAPRAPHPAFSEIFEDEPTWEDAEWQ